MLNTGQYFRDRKNTIRRTKTCVIWFSIWEERKNEEEAIFRDTISANFPKLTTTEISPITETLRMKKKKKKVKKHTPLGSHSEISEGGRGERERQR